MSTSAALPTMSRDWQHLGDQSYRKVPFFPATWPATVPHLQPGDFSLDDQIIAVAPLGGHIAMVRDERLLSSVRAGGETRIRVFTSAGRLISQFLWPHHGLVQLGWTPDEQLVCVMEDGLVMIYTVHGSKAAEFRLGEACRAEGVVEASISNGCIVARAGKRSQLFCVTDLANPVVSRLPDPALKAPCTSMAVLAPTPLAALEGRLPIAYLGTGRGSLVVVDPNLPSTQRQVVELELSQSPVTHLTLSPSMTQLAAFSGGTVQALPLTATGAPRRAQYSFNTQAQKPPVQVVWCGDDAPALYWREPRALLLLAGSGESFISLTFPSQLVLAAEPDGLRAVSEDECVLIQRVPDAAREALSSTDGYPDTAAAVEHVPAAVLLEAKAAFDAGDARADDLVRSLVVQGSSLPKAVASCLATASQEVSVPAQMALLSAAAFGRLSCSPDDDADDDDAALAPDAVADASRALRVLNSVRSARTGMALTAPQYAQLGPDRLIDRLVAQHDHLLALRISQSLRASPSRVLLHWAQAKVASAPPSVRDADLAAAIVGKFTALCPGESYGPVALVASRLMRRSLAAALLEHEPRAAQQVPLLLAIREDDIALSKAVASGDADLIYSVLLQLKAMLSPKEMVAALADKPLARNLYVAHCRKYDPESLKLFYSLQAMPVEAGHVAIAEALEAESFSKRQEMTKVALDLYKRDANTPFFAQIAEEQRRLLDEQRALGPATVGMSVSELIEALIADSQRDRALRIKNDYKVPDRRFWQIEVKTLARRGHWGSLAKLVANRKTPPIGFTPFIEACVENGAPHEAVQYILMLSDPHEQIEWLGSIQHWKEAADIAFKEKDIDALGVIRTRCRNPTLAQSVEKMMAQLSR